MGINPRKRNNLASRIFSSLIQRAATCGLDAWWAANQRTKYGRMGPWPWERSTKLPTTKATANTVKKNLNFYAREPQAARPQPAASPYQLLAQAVRCAPVRSRRPPLAGQRSPRRSDSDRRSPGAPDAEPGPRSPRLPASQDRRSTASRARQSPLARRLDSRTHQPSLARTPGWHLHRRRHQ
jgi:hypothetical protein